MLLFLFVFYFNILKVITIYLTELCIHYSVFKIEIAYIKYDYLYYYNIMANWIFNFFYRAANLWVAITIMLRNTGISNVFVTRKLRIVSRNSYFVKS